MLLDFQYNDFVSANRVKLSILISMKQQIQASLIKSDKSMPDDKMQMLALAETNSFDDSLYIFFVIQCCVNI